MVCAVDKSFSLVIYGRRLERIDFRCLSVKEKEQACNTHTHTRIPSLAHVVFLDVDHASRRVGVLVGQVRVCACARVSV
jgi:hypothetical protein